MSQLSVASSLCVDKTGIINVLGDMLAVFAERYSPSSFLTIVAH